MGTLRTQDIFITTLVAELPTVGISKWQRALVSDVKYEWDGTAWVLGWGATSSTASNVASTGLLNGGVITINADPTKFDLSAGAGWIVDHSTFPSTLTEVLWTEKLAVSVPDIGTRPATDLAIDINGNIVQQLSFTQEEKRSLIFLGGLSHLNNTTIGRVFPLHVMSKGVGSNVYELSQAIGDINLTGNVFGANGPNLNINKTAGTTFSYGRNNVNNSNDPNTATQAVQSPSTFLYVANDGIGGGQFSGPHTLVNPNEYDAGTGVLAAVPNNQWTIQRILMFSNSGVPVLQYGTEVYSRKSDALADLSYHPFLTLSGITSAMVRGYLVVQQSATDLSDLTSAEFLVSDRFGQVSSSGGAAAIVTMQDVYDNSTVPETLIADKVGGAVTLKGAATQTNESNIFEVVNNADAPLFSVDFAGNVAATGTVTGSNLSGTNTGDQDLSGYITTKLPWLKTTAAGQYTWEVGGVPFAHNFTPANVSGDWAQNAFFGLGAGNYTMGGTSFQGGINNGFGSLALASLTTGSQNDMFGTEAGFAITSGNWNVGIGAAALYSLTTGSNNISIGKNSLQNALATTDITAVGFNAGYWFGAAGSGDLLTAGDDHTLIGARARPSANSTVNEIAIGHDARGRGSNTAVIGNTSITKVSAGADYIATNATDLITKGHFDTFSGAANELDDTNLFLDKYDANWDDGGNGVADGFNEKVFTTKIGLFQYDRIGLTPIKDAYYDVNIHVDLYSAGAIGVSVGVGEFSNEYVQASGWHTIRVKAGSSSTLLNFTFPSAFSGTIDWVSVKQVSSPLPPESVYTGTTIQPNNSHFEQASTLRSTSASTTSVLIPDTLVAAEGDRITVVREGDGVVSLVPSGVTTINGSTSPYVLSTKYDQVELISMGLNTDQYRAVKSLANAGTITDVTIGGFSTPLSTQTIGTTKQISFDWDIPTLVGATARTIDTNWNGTMFVNDSDVTALAITLPLGSTSSFGAFPSGFNFSVGKFGTANIVITPTGGPTVNGSTAPITISTQYEGAMTFICMGGDDWYMFGNL